MIVVANRSRPAVQEVSRKDFEHSIERKVDIVLPFDAKAAAQAAKLGQPLAKVDQVGQAVAAARPAARADRSSRPTAKAPRRPQPASGGSLLGKLGNFKSLVAKKPKEAAAGRLTAA